MIQPSRRPLQRHSRVPASATRQRGVVAILLAVIAVAAAGAAFGNFMLRRMDTSQADIQGQRAVLQWADHAVRGYALMNDGNLPCPASIRNGPANCGQGLKGWLPVRSLVQATGGEPPPEHVMLDIRYMVNRNALASGPGVTPRDFTKFAPVFAPALIDGSPVYPPSDRTRSTMDLCATLRDISGVFTNGLGEVKRWRIAADKPALAPNVTLAPGQLVYGVAVAAAGASFEASGVNASFAVPAIESPLRPVDQTYTDLVSVTRPADFYDELQCGPTIASLDTMAVAQTWIATAEGQRQGNIAAGQLLGDIARLGVIADAASMVVTFGDLGNGLYNLKENSAKLMAAIGTWQFYKIPTYIKGLAYANVGVGRSAVDVGIGAVGLGLDLSIMNAYYQLKKDAEDQTVWLGGSDILQDAHLGGIAPWPPLPSAGGSP